MTLKQIVFGILFGSVIFTGCTHKNDFLKDQIGSYRNYINIQGEINNEIYTFPNNIFQFKVPSLVKPGAKIKDYKDKDYRGGISFSDDIGTLIRVEFINKNVIKGNNNKEILEKSSTFLYNTMYKPTGMNVKLLHNDFIGDKLYAIFDFPNGSSIANNNKRLNAVRASVFFIKDNNLFIITRQSTEGIFKRAKYKYNDIPHMIKLLQSDLEDFQ